MSSFFTVPGKRKRTAPATEAPKKRQATTKSLGKGPSKASKLSKTKLKPTSKPTPAPRRTEQDDESISGSDSESDDGADAVEDGEVSESGSDSEHEGETPAQRRLRLAERYLEGIRAEVDTGAEGFDAEDLDREIIAQRLRESVAEKKGKVFRQLADQLAFDKASHCLFRWDSFGVTAISACAPYVYTVTKCHQLTKWKIQELPENQYPQTTKNPPKKPPPPPRKKPDKVGTVKGNKNKGGKGNKGGTGEILAVAASQDGKFVCTGDSNGQLVVYDASLKQLRVFTHHRDSILSLAFRRNTNQLFSASADRTIKVWSLDELAYVETLYGHQDHVLDVDALGQERCVSVGSRDRTARLWKVVEETQLVFRKSTGGSIDRVAMLDEELFVTGSDDGALALWSIQKKKPLFVLPKAHGLDPPLSPTEASAEQCPDAKKVVPPPQPRWITALRTLPYSDLIFSGSWDGYVRVWKLSEDKKSIKPVGILGAPTSTSPPEVNGSGDHPMTGNDTSSDDQTPWNVKGVINDISVFQRDERGKGGMTVVIAVGKEHRLGKWIKTQGGKNGAVIFEVPRVEEEKVETNGDSMADD